MNLTVDNLQLSQVKCDPVYDLTLQLTAPDPNIPVAALAYLQAAISDNTRRAYRADLAHFLSWGGSIPASSQMLAQYLAEFASQLSVATLTRRIVSIGRAHTSQGMASPIKSDLVKATLRGIRRTYGVAQRQVAPALREDILGMVQGLSGAKGTRDRALLLLGFAGAFRRSELIGLNVKDLDFSNRGLLVALGRSKTDQEGRGRKIAIPFARGSVCAVQAVKDWLSVLDVAEGPLFRGVDRHGRISSLRLSSNAVADIVKFRAAALGLHPGAYAGHSLRAGLITSAAKLGVSIWKIKAQSGHRSDAMVARYVRDVDLFANNAAGAVL